MYKLLFILFIIKVYARINIFQIRDKAKLNKRTIEILLSELWVLDDQDKNKETIRQYAQNMGIVVT